MTLPWFLGVEYFFRNITDFLYIRLKELNSTGLKCARKSNNGHPCSSFKTLHNCYPLSIFPGWDLDNPYLEIICRLSIIYLRVLLKIISNFSVENLVANSHDLLRHTYVVSKLNTKFIEQTMKYMSSWNVFASRGLVTQPTQPIYNF